MNWSGPWKWTRGTLSAILLRLELCGLVQQEPGAQFSRKSQNVMER